MMTLTHLVIGSTATSLLLGSADPVILLTGAIASLLPDVDISASPAGRLLFPISRFLESRFPHRSATHSLVASLAIACIDYPLAVNGFIPLELAHAINIGYFTGYFADVFTKSGIEMFYPSPVRCVCPGNRNLRLSTGSAPEYAVLGVFIAIAFIALSINMKGGLTVELNRYLATPNGVEQIYNKQGSDYLIAVNVEGVRAIDRQPVKGEYQLVQAHGLGFIVTDGQRVYKVGVEPDVQLISEKITGHAGRKAKTLIKTISLNDEAIAPQLQAIQAANSDAQIYLSGNLKLDDSEDLQIATDPQQFKTISKQQESLSLEAAPLSQALPLLSEQWATGQITVRIVYVQ
jgi:inner membrane protein